MTENAYVLQNRESPRGGLRALGESDLPVLAHYVFA